MKQGATVKDISPACDNRNWAFKKLEVIKFIADLILLSGEMYRWHMACPIYETEEIPDGILDSVRHS